MLELTEYQAEMLSLSDTLQYAKNKYINTGQLNKQSKERRDKN